MVAKIEYACLRLPAPREAGKQPACSLLPAVHPQHLRSLPHLTMCLQGQHSESSRLPTHVDPRQSAQTLLQSPSPAVRSSCLASQVFVPSYSFLWVPTRSPSALGTLSVLTKYLMLSKRTGPRKAPPRGERGKTTESHRGTKAPCHSGASRRFAYACTEPSPRGGCATLRPPRPSTPSVKGSLAVGVHGEAAPPEPGAPRSGL